MKSLIISGGKYYTHCNGVNSLHAVQYFENFLSNIGVPIEIERTEAFVPSFCEKWVFFQLTRKEGDITEDVNGDAVDNEVEEKVPVVNGNDAEKSDLIEEEKKEETKKETKKEDTKKKEVKKEKAAPEKKEDKKGGAKDLKDKLETDKEKGLTKEKSNLDKKGKKAK